MAKIMIVDDDRELLELLTFTLTKKGHQVTVASDGKECLEHLAEGLPDLIVLDVMMPGIDGFSVFNQLSQHKITREIPVIVLTAREQMRQSFQDAGRLADFMVKPFEMEDLLDRVAAILPPPRKNLNPKKS